MPPHAMAEFLEKGLALQQAQQDALAGQPGAARHLRTLVPSCARPSPGSSSEPKPC
jgi:hypothetical protein